MKTTLITLLAACAVNAAFCADKSLINYVEPRVGTAHNATSSAGLFGKGTEELGQTLPAVLEPHGMNFWTAQTRDTERKCIAPYYYDDTLLQGFRNSHWIVGGCTQDYGSMTLMPLFGTLRCRPVERASEMARDSEISSPSYYSIELPQEGILTEMTGRSRSAIFNFTYSNPGVGYIVVNPNSDEGQGYIEVDIASRQIRGYNPVHRIYQGVGESAGFSGYFVIEWQDDLKVSGYGVYAGDSVFSEVKSIGNVKELGAYLQFDVAKGETVKLKAASSFVSVEGAIANLNAEIPHWDFNSTRSELTSIWESQLGVIKVNVGNDVDKRKFYSALYRSMFLPHEFNDVDGRYPSFAGGKTINTTLPGHAYYEDYSMWDTYRALHPLLNILSPSLAGDMMQSLIDKYEQGGWLPIFPCWNSYTAAMIGDHCIATLADAYVKGVKGFDIEKAYEAMRKNAFTSPDNFDDYKNGMGRRALTSYLRYGYIPLEDSVKEAYHKQEQVSRTLEYAFDDFALAQVAKALGKKDDYKALMERAGNYRNVINPSTGYACGRHANGNFIEGNDPVAFTKFITEGVPCHYTWYVPHDQYGLMKRMGGRDAYIARLDSMFSYGRYWHGNEPCHQVAWLFNYAGQPWKTQKAVRHIMATEYFDLPGGLSGNDDAGQMSAWYIFAAIGFYPVCPATPYYIIGSPSFQEVNISLENGKTFTIKAENASEDNIYIRSAKLNGKNYDKNYLTHEDIMNGGIFEVVMGDRPNALWGSSRASLPPSVIK